MKKVLLVTHVSGFVPQFEMNNVRILQNLGYEVHYASNYFNVSYGTDNSRLDGTGIVRHQVDFARSPFHIKTHVKAYRQLKEVMEKEGFSLVHCHTPVGGALARLAAKPYRKTGCKVIYTAHGFHFFKGAPLKFWLLFYPVERLLAGITDVVVTINTEDFQRAKRFCKHKKTRVEYLPGVGVNTAYWSGEDLQPGEKEEIRARKRAEFGVTEETLLLSVGELIPRKNHEEVIRALAKEKNRENKNFRYLICGHGELQTYLQELIEELDLAGEVTLLGYRQDIRELLYAADLFVFPSKQEGMPMALMEAAAAGVPLKASSIRGSREVVADVERFGCLPKQYDVNCVKEKMRRIYEEI